MTALHLESADAKHVRLAGLDPVTLSCLFEVPAILEKLDHPAVQDRLFPDPAPADPAVSADWQQWVRPELRHLFVSAGEVFARDLAGLLAAPPTKDLPAVLIPQEHLPAWMSALNQARLILGQLHEVTEADMDRRDLDPHAAKDRALFTIHVLGFVLQLFLERGATPPDEEAAP
jgi:hypothetical protein